MIIFISINMKTIWLKMNPSTVEQSVPCNHSSVIDRHRLSPKIMISNIDVRQLSTWPIEVRVVRVQSPTMFWVKLINDEAAHKEMLERMALRMRFAAPQLILSPNEIIIGTLVAIREGSKWQRGIIEYVGATSITVNLRDWARTTERMPHECLRLESQFHEMRWQAIPCVLNGILPLRAQVWTEQEVVHAKIIMEKTQGWIIINDVLSDNAALVSYLRGGQTENVPMIDVSTLFIQIGIAKKI
ncbi:uncharacterized protein [Cardiocondyla obscurior]|uniref:uncharacterized protein n=1 Tax=Cardiocondyla obscurior TaxID=286306 RepID=UPI0039656AC3